MSFAAFLMQTLSSCCSFLQACKQVERKRFALQPNIARPDLIVVFESMQGRAFLVRKHLHGGGDVSGENMSSNLMLGSDIILLDDFHD